MGLCTSQSGQFPAGKENNKSGIKRGPGLVCLFVALFVGFSGFERALTSLRGLPHEMSFSVCFHSSRQFTLTSKIPQIQSG